MTSPLDSTNARSNNSGVPVYSTAGYQDVAYVDWDGLVYYDSKVKEYIRQTSLPFGGIVKFTDLPDPSYDNVNHLYQVNEEFVSDNRFRDPGYKYSENTWVRVTSFDDVYLYTIFVEQLSVEGNITSAINRINDQVQYLLENDAKQEENISNISNQLVLTNNEVRNINTLATGAHATAIEAKATADSFESRVWTNEQSIKSLNTFRENTIEDITSINNSINSINNVFGEVTELNSSQTAQLTNHENRLVAAEGLLGQVAEDDVTHPLHASTVVDEIKRLEDVKITHAQMKAYVGPYVDGQIDNSLEHVIETLEKSEYVVSKSTFNETVDDLQQHINTKLSTDYYEQNQDLRDAQQQTNLEALEVRLTEKLNTGDLALDTKINAVNDTLLANLNARASEEAFQLHIADNAREFNNIAAKFDETKNYVDTEVAKVVENHNASIDEINVKLQEASENLLAESAQRAAEDARIGDELSALDENKVNVVDFNDTVARIRTVIDVNAQSVATEMREVNDRIEVAETKVSNNADTIKEHDKKNTAEHKNINKRIDEVLAQIGDIVHFRAEIVDTLEEVTEVGILYLIKDESVQGADIYKEYLFIDNAPVLIGDTSLDLSSYATKEMLNASAANLDTKFEAEVDAINESIKEVKNDVDDKYSEVIEVANQLDSKVTSEHKYNEAIYIKQKFEVLEIPDLDVLYTDREIRLNTSKLTFTKQAGEHVNKDPNSYYVGIKAYAPENADSFKEQLGDQPDETIYTFEGDFAGIDEHGRKYSIIWLPIARFDTATNTWKNWGDNSTTEKYIGWNYSVEWLNGESRISSDAIRINVTNDSCHRYFVGSEIVRYVTAAKEESYSKLLDKTDFTKFTEEVSRKYSTKDELATAKEDINRAVTDLDTKIDNSVAAAKNDAVNEANSYTNEVTAKFIDKNELEAEVDRQIAEKVTGGEINLNSFANKAWTKDYVADVTERIRYAVVPVENLICDYKPGEIRLNAENVTFVDQPNKHPNKVDDNYYIGLKIYAPADAAKFKEDLDTKITDDTFYFFEGNDFAGIESTGAKYSIIWLAVAYKQNNEWVYWGNNSSTDKYIGYYYTVEWYDNTDHIISSETIRINLTNSECHNYYVPGETIRYVTNVKDSLTEVIDAADTALASSIDAVNAKFTKYVTFKELENKKYLTDIPAEYVTETELSNELENYINGVSHLATKEELTTAKNELAGSIAEVSDKVDSKVGEVNTSINNILGNITNIGQQVNGIDSKVDEQSKAVAKNAEDISATKTQIIDVQNQLADNLHTNAEELAHAIQEAEARVAASYVTKTDLDSRGYLTEHQSLENYATTEFVNGSLSELAQKYYTKAETKDAIAEAIKNIEIPAAGVTTEQLAAEVNRAQSAEQALQDKINLIIDNPDTENAINSLKEFSKYVEDHATIAEGFRKDIDDISGKVSELKNIDHNAFALKSEVPKNVSDLTNDEGYITASDIPETDLSNYYTKSETETLVNEAVDGIELPEAELYKVDFNTPNFAEALEAYNSGKVLVLINAAPDVNSYAVMNYVSDKYITFTKFLISRSEAYGAFNTYYLSVDNTWELAKEVILNKVEANIEGEIAGNLSTVRIGKEIFSIPETDLTGYATEEYVTSEIAKIEIPDASDFIRAEELANKADNILFTEDYYVTNPVGGFEKDNSLKGMTIRDILITLLALKQIKKYSLKFFVDGELHDEKFIEEATPIQFPEIDPVKEGYIFDGWKVGDLWLTDTMTMPDYDLEAHAAFSEKTAEPELPEASGIIEDIMVNEIPMYSVTADGELLPISYNLIDGNEEPTSSGFFAYVDESNVVTKAGYQDISIKNDEMYYFIALPKNVDYNSIVEVETWDPDDKKWIESELGLTSDADIVNELADEVGLDLSHIPTDKYTIWTSEDICTGSIIRYIIKETL